MTRPDPDAALAAMLADLTRSAGLPPPTRPLTPAELAARLQDTPQAPPHAAARPAR